MAYCTPDNTSGASTPAAVARKLGHLLDAIDHFTGNFRLIARGQIEEDLRELRLRIMDGLEAEGWTVSAQNGRLQGTDRVHVYPPGSPSGAKIRKWRESITTNPQ